MKKNPSHIVYDAGCSIYEIAFYDSSIQWHNNLDVIHCYSYTEAIQAQRAETISQFKFDTYTSLYDGF